MKNKEDDDCGMGLTYGPDNDCSSTRETNMTACADGYYNGFIHWCSTDVKDCADKLKGGTGPVQITRPN
ncbi:MAG: hypothetical protein WAM14_22535 [Candidatus Nitrosopolaris sp.]